jgi:hypothetical protein
MNANNPNESAGTVPPTISSNQPQHKPGLTRKGWIVVVMAGVLLILAVVLVPAIKAQLRERKQLATLTAISRLTYPDQLAKARALCTPQGFNLLKQISTMSDRFEFDNLKVTGFKENPRMVDVSMMNETAEGTSRVFVRLVYRGGWKFQDVLLVQVNGKKCHLWLSYVVDHPVLATVALNQDDIARGLNEVGTKVVRGVEVAERILNLIQGFKALSDHGR